MLATAGGTDIEKFVQNILLKIGTYQLWQDYNFTGRNEKRSLAGTYLLTLVLSKYSLLE